MRQIISCRCSVRKPCPRFTAAQFPQAPFIFWHVMCAILYAVSNTCRSNQSCSGISRPKQITELYVRLRDVHKLININRFKWCDCIMSLIRKETLDKYIILGMKTYHANYLANCASNWSVRRTDERKEHNSLENSVKMLLLIICWATGDYFFAEKHRKDKHVPLLLFPSYFGTPTILVPIFAADRRQSHFV